MGTRETWPGGYVHRQTNGQPLYIIEREVSGKRFHKSTRAHSLRAAMKQLERFEANPRGYDPLGLAEDEPLLLGDELILDFHQWQLDKGNVSQHANAMANLMTMWLEDLGARNLKTLDLGRDIIPHLDRRKTRRRERIEAIKVFFSWLRKVRHVVTHAQDPTLNDLPVPQAVPEKRRRRKAVELVRFRKAAAKLSGTHRDMLLVLAATGWHVSELHRFIRGGELVKRGKVTALVTLHKNRRDTRTPIRDPVALAAAERLRALGSVPRVRINEALRIACELANVKRFTAGVMRHTVGTWSVELGADPARVSQFLDHRDRRTTERFYIDVHVPTVEIPLPKLR